MIDKKLFVVLLFLLLQSQIYAQSFYAQGSDLLMGVGAKNIATAGAKSANTDDIYAMFYNPAGLAEIDSGEFVISTQADAQLGLVNFIGIAYSFPLESLDLKLTLAMTFMPRLYIESSGAYHEGDFESIFLRYTLPGLSANFDGEINSKTDDYRFAMAMTPLHSPTWSLGISVGYVNCATTFAGVALEDPTNFTYMSTVAKATAFGLGAKYYLNEDITFGLNLRNIDSKLTVKVHTTDDNGESYETYDVDFPYDFSAGVSWKYSKSVDLAADYQQVFGTYGNYNLDFKLLRFGGSLHDGSLDYHLGFIVPIVIGSDNIDDIDLPAPLMPTVGMGWHNNIVDLSLAFYIHPIMTLNLGRPSPSLDLSLSYKF